VTRRRLLILVVILLVPVAIHAIWDQAESTLLARDIADIARRGEPVDVIARRLRPATPEQGRAAGLYAAAADLARWQARDDGYDMTRKDVELPATDPRLDEARLKTYLADSEPALQLLRLAEPLDFGGFGSIAPELYTNQSSLQTLSGMSNLRADISSARGEGDLAADELVRSICLQRTITIPYYRYVSVGRLYGSLRILLKHAPPGDESLRRLQLALEMWPDDDGVVADLQRERAQRLGALWPYSADRASWALRPQQGFRAGPADAMAFLVFRPLLTHAVRRQLDSFAEAIAIAREPWPTKLESERALARRYGIDPSRSLSKIDRILNVIDSLGVLDLNSTLPISGMNLAFRRTAIAAVAAERFRHAHAGQPPPSLDALVPGFLASVPQDPFDGKPLKYRADGESYVIYSVDINRVDDHGALYGFGTGIPGASHPILNDPSPRDIGIRVPLTPLNRFGKLARPVTRAESRPPL
jgi:hypothetical protein